MSYIGNQPLYQPLITDTFSGNGSTTQYQLTVAPPNASSVIVAVSGVLQAPSTYGIVGRILTFSVAPPTGAENISIRYLGLTASNTPNTAYRSVTDLTATAGQTTFAPASYTPGYINVYRNGVRLGITNFTATNGATVVLSTAANLGDLLTFESFFVSSVLNAIPSIGGAITASFLDVGSRSGSGAMIVPVGSTVERPAAPAAGMQRFNTTLSSLEFYNGTLWGSVASGYTVEYLVVGGGGAGGSSSVNSSTGGGGAGGYIAGTFVTLPSLSYPVVVGAGGTGVLNSSGNDGGSSFAFSITALGGGGGGGGTSNTATSPGRPGGSGGGSLQPQGPGAGTLGQGNSGGTGNPNSPSWGGGGGGGAGAAGTSGTPTNAGPGGVGRQWSNGNFYAGGGGGATYNGHIGGAGGQGGGGAGGSTSAGTAGTANTGGGGGAASYPGSTYGAGANGGSGVVIIRYPGNQRGTGGVVTSAGGFTIHTFTSSGTFTS